MKEYKVIDLKDLNKEQKEVIKHINNMIIEYQQIFQDQPEELVVSQKDFSTLCYSTSYKYLLLGKIKIFNVYDYSSQAEQKD